MPIEKVSLNDPFAYQNSDTETSSTQNLNNPLKRHRKTMQYSKITANSETDLAYIRLGSNQRKVQLEAAGNIQFLDPIENLPHTDSPPKKVSIGSKNYFMPRMIIACEKLEPIKPINSKKSNQSLVSEE
jgi:hypothetical protein